MSTQDYAASVQGVAIRVTRLNADGTLKSGALDSYTLSKFISLSFTPEYESGEEITQKTASGTTCIGYTAPDTLKNVGMEIGICEPDPEFTSLTAGGVLLTKEISTITKSVGWAAPEAGADPSANGVAVEVWSYAVKGSKRASSFPYYHWIFPFVKLRQSGDRVIENGALANTFSGIGDGNVGFDDGPDGKWEWPSVANRPYAYARSAWAPLNYNGFYTWTDMAVEGTAVTTITDVGAGVNIPGESTYVAANPTDYILSSDMDPS